MKRVVLLISLIAILFGAVIGAGQKSNINSSKGALIYAYDFSSLGDWTIINNGNAKTWVVPSNKVSTLFPLVDGSTTTYKAAFIDYAGLSALNDDWLVSPGIALEAGKRYTMRFDMGNCGVGTELLKVFIGRGVTVENLNTELVDYALVTNGNLNVGTTTYGKEFSFTVPSTGTYNIGFYNCSWGGNASGLLMSNLEITEAEPALTVPYFYDFRSLSPIWVITNIKANYPTTTPGGANSLQGFDMPSQSSATLTNPFELITGTINTTSARHAAAQITRAITTSKPHNDWLISPSFALKAGKEYSLRFDCALQMNGTELLKVFLGTNYTVAGQTTELGSYTIVASAAGDPAGTIYNKAIEFTVPTDGLYNISFYDYSAVNTCGSLLISNFELKEIPPALAQNDLGCVGISGDGVVVVNEDNIYTVVVNNFGQLTQNNYKVQLVNGNDEVVAEKTVTDAIEFNQTKNIQITYKPTVGGDVVLFGKVVLANDENLENDKTEESLSVSVRNMYEVKGKVTNRVFTTLADCNVTLTGFRDYSFTTLADGLFTISNVVAGDYTLTITRQDYNNYTSSVTVGGNVDLGGIILERKAGYGVVYSYDFTSIGDWTVIDDVPGESYLGNSATWSAPGVYPNPFPAIPGVNNAYKSAQCFSNGIRRGNDWLISPNQTLVGGEVYKLSFDVASGYSDDVESLRVFVGKGVTSAAQTQQIGDFETINYAVPQNKLIEFSVEESGEYNIGFLYRSASATGFRLIMSNVVLQGMIKAELFKDLAAVNFQGETSIQTDYDNMYTVTIENKGIEAQNNFTVQLLADGTVVDSKLVTTEIAPEATMNVRLVYNPSTEGTVSLTGKILLDLDEDTSNNNTSAITVTASNHSLFELPGAPTSVVATRSQMSVTVNWNAPATGINGGLFDAGTLVYKVTRTPDYVVVADNITATTFTETLANAGTYGYRVQAKNALGDGGVGVSNNIKVGGSYSVPYTYNFPTIGEWTVIDANGDGATNNYAKWGAPATGSGPIENIFPNKYAAQYKSKVSGTLKQADDWLISPAIELQAGKTYRLKLDAAEQYYGSTDKFKVTIGKGKTAASQSTVIADHSIVAATASEELVIHEKIMYITVEETADYYIGLYCYSAPFSASSINGGGGLLISNFEITAGFEHDLSAIAISGPNKIQTNKETAYTVSVLNKGSETASNYTVQLVNGDHQVVASKVITNDPLITNTKKDIAVGYNPANPGDVVLFGKVVLEGDQETSNDRTTSFVEVQIRNAYNVAGTVVDNAGAPVSGANINVKGFYPYSFVTASDGKFTLNNVFAADNYSIQIWKDGYGDYNSTFNVTNAELSLGNITLTETIVAPYGLTIVDNGRETERLFKYSNEGSIFDNFEDHTPFTVASPGRAGWSYIDGDNSAIYVPDYTFPGYFISMKSSFMVFNPFQTTPPVNNDQALLAHSGNQYIAAFACVDPINEDYIISPKLNFGVDFKLKFWVKSGTDEFGLERYQVGYSKTGKEMGDFNDWVQLGLYEEAPLNWTQVSYTIPGDAKYVTIKCVSDDAWVLMIDDIFIGVDEPATKSFSKYEIYLDGVKKAETTERSYNFTELSLGNHTAGVKAIYSTGESALKTIDFVTAQKYTVNMSATSGGSLVVKAGNTVLTNGIGVDANTSITITATPEAGYDLTSLTVNGANFTSGGTYTVNSNIDIAVVFTQKLYTVTIEQPAVGGTITVKAGETVINSGNTVPHATQIVIENTPAEKYILKQIKINGIAITGNKYTVVKDIVVSAEFMSTDGVKDEQDANINIYPNPTKDVIYIDGEYINAEIYDINGKLVKSINANDSRVDISELSAAIYILKVNLDNKQITRRIIKQ